ncbi:MAG: 4'-phosphopantetheinyl transferase superfamily protein [bacterium]|nr:4'-phosphopantetheinyl transferase superfamily protein [bacterium]
MTKIFALQIPGIPGPNAGHCPAVSSTVPFQWGEPATEFLTAHVSPERVRLIRGLKKETDKLTHLFSRLFIRYIIMRELGLKNRDIVFYENETGKPALKGVEDFHFNLSHSGPWITAAVDSRPVGIDTEHIGPMDTDVAAMFFSRQECRELFSHKEKPAFYFSLWTLKESFIKKNGTGWDVPLNLYTMQEVAPDRFRILRNGEAVEGNSFALYDIHKEYKTALCLDRDGYPAKIEMVELEDVPRAFTSR